VLRCFKCCCIAQGQRICANDADSVAAWVEANRQDGDRCLVRYVKFQGVPDTSRNLRQTISVL